MHIFFFLSLPFECHKMTLINADENERKSIGPSSELEQHYYIYNLPSPELFKLPFKMRDDRNELSLDGFMINHGCLFFCDL